MLLNDAKGSYGMYSRAGWMTTETFHLLRRKDEILSGNPTRILIKGNFIPDDPLKSIHDEEEQIDIFGKETCSFNNNKKLHQSQLNIKQNLIKKKLKKFQNNKIVKKQEIATCTKYRPKYDYIWKRCIVGPSWDTSLKRYFIAKPKKDISSGFLLSNTQLNIKGKNLIEFSKMTNREMNKTSSQFNTRNKDDEKENLHALTTTITSEQNLRTEESQKSVQVIKNKIDNKNKKYNKVQAPDFKKIISRDHLDRIIENKKPVFPFKFPNNSFTTSRTINYVSFDKMLKRKSPKEKDIFEPDVDYDPDKLLMNINNYKKPKTPNFQVMRSRAIDGSPLPSYMKVYNQLKKQIFDKQSTILFTENSLKMNNFSDGKFAKTETSFWPKKSFNKIINLNLMNSTNFKQNLGIKTDKFIDKNEEYISKSMKFYNKNYKELIKESLISKFDNVTFKSLKNPSRKDKKEIDTFFDNYGKDDIIYS